MTRLRSARVPDQVCVAVEGSLSLEDLCLSLNTSCLSHRTEVAARADVRALQVSSFLIAAKRANDSGVSCFSAQMEGLTEHSDADRPPLCASTIQYLAAQGLIDPTYDSRLALTNALQGLQTGEDEQDGLTDDDDDDEQLAAQLIEPKGPNPQQQMFSDKPAGPTTLVEEGKAFIARAPLPAENLLTAGKVCRKLCRSYISDELTMFIISFLSHRTLKTSVTFCGPRRACHATRRAQRNTYLKPQIHFQATRS